MLPYAQRTESSPWFSVGEQLDGAAAYERVKAVHHFDRSHAYCLYLHVPCCETVCTFCALYTFGVGRNAEDTFDRYLDSVLRSLDDNPWAGSAQAPTTVHFGGGTPLSIGTDRF